jgi:hypothetical protein
MADLNELRQQINAAREAREEAAQAHVSDELRLRALRQHASEFQRRVDPANEEHETQRQDLAEQIGAATAKTAVSRDTKLSTVANLANLAALLEPLTDPRQTLSALDARYPILLFPVRLETRFVTNVTGRRELLVRIYPDECLIDSFEPDLSESEVKNLRRYWCSMWAAGGDDGFERAAWRELAAAHGAGRAMYLVQQYLPLAGSDAIPPRGDASDMILAVPVDAPLAGTEKDAVVDYWEAAWRAGSDEIANRTAYDNLRGAVGDTRAEEIRKTLEPFNVKERPQQGVDRAAVAVFVVFVVLTPIADAAKKRQAWTRAPEARLLPERFVLFADSGPEHVELLGGMIQQPLPVGPDPLAEPADQFDNTSADLIVPAQLRWMTDFETALKAGMAFRIALTPRQAQSGFDRLYVLGVRLTADHEQGRKELESLIQHSGKSQSGFAIVPQGTPTNNSEEGSSGWSRVQEADELFDVARLAQAGVPQFNEAATAPYEKRDGLILAEALGIDAAVLQDIPNADGTDQIEARAMNAALWPATLGYWMDTQMSPAFDALTIERTRRHFIHRVTGRGSVPAIRIGKQPYGILPTTALSRLQWPKSDVPTTRFRPDNGHITFLTTLQALLSQLAISFWKVMANNVPRVGKDSPNSQQQLLDILGLHPSSVEFHLNVVDSAERIWNTSRFFLFSRSRLRQIMRDQMAAGSALLRSLGYTGETDPEIISKFFAYVHGPMKRPVIDDAPLSEIATLPICTDDDKNYIEWCRTKAQTAFDDLRLQRGFSAGKVPNALLYHMLRHALQLGYHHIALNLHETSGLMTTAEVTAAYREPSFVHIGTPVLQNISESRYHFLYTRQPAITGGVNQTIAEFIPTWLGTSGVNSVLADQLAALAVLESADTASLERAFAEHIDLCSYRWDGWTLSLVNERLHELRRPEGDEQPRRLGIHLGAFGWIEDLKPDTAVLTAPTLSDDARTVFQRQGEAPLQRDPANGGFALAPSLNHATTAAVLRNGYLNNAVPTEPNLFAVDLSSSRVRVALQFIEGMRNGQPLGALLGYQFERQLHDRHAEAELDHLIYEVRKAFPLAAKRISDTVDSDADSAAIENVEARNVCDGVLLLNHVRTNPVKTYPWGKSIERGSPAQEAIINEEVAALFQIHDSIADVVIAETVHQVTTGNVDRAAGVMDAFSKGGFPPEPDVVNTPRNGTALTHRVGLHLPADAVASSSATARAQSEPAIDAWLQSVLPPLNDIVVHVRWQNTPPGSTQDEGDVDMQALGLSPIDLVYLLDTSNEQAMNELDDRLIDHVISTESLSPDASVEIRYTERVAGKKTAFEMAALISSLRAIVLDSRPLVASDAMLQNEAVSAAPVIPPGQITAARSEVDEVRSGAVMVVGTLAPLIDDTVPFANVVAAVDAAITDYITLQFKAALCGVGLAGAGSILDARRQWFQLVRKTATELFLRWQGKLVQCDAHLIVANDPGASDLMKIEALEKAEREISTTYTSPIPATPGSLLSIVNGKRATFTAAQSQVQAVANSADTTINALWTAWSATFAGRSAIDLTVADTKQEEERVRLMIRDMHRQVTGLHAEVVKRREKADALVAEANTVIGQRKVELQTDAAKQLLGDGFRIVPRFTLSAEQGEEWQNSFNARSNLLTHLSPAHDFPVDDWLHGIARVRPKLHELENIILLTEAFASTTPELAPVQFPFRATEPWLAMELPATFDVNAAGDHLLYTASYVSNTFDKTAPAFAGLLLDEWTEVIPATKETAGLTFNYDRPGNEPPQTMLLVTPAGTEARWDWEDLRSAIPETFALARKRAVEPRDIAKTPLARLLPATLMAFTTHAISISSYLRVADVEFATAVENDG